MDTREAGRMGGQARAKNLSASKRKEIATTASRKRWSMLTPKQSASNTPMLTPKHTDIPSTDKICKHKNRERYCSACQRALLEK